MKFYPQSIIYTTNLFFKMIGGAQSATMKLKPWSIHCGLAWQPWMFGDMRPLK